MEIVGSWPEEPGGPIIIREYHHRYHDELIAAYHAEALELNDLGYETVGQHYLDGEWGFWRMLVASTLTPFLIGIIMWLYMASTRPIGTLTVTYLRRDQVE